MTYRKKLIEVALPLEAINVASAREKSIRHGHPSTLHLWWARRPLAACRAVLFASLVDDPSSDPMFGGDEDIEASKRAELFNLIEELVLWENSNNLRVINKARAEIARCIASRKIETGELKNDQAIALTEEGDGRTSKRYTPHDVKHMLASPEAVNHFLATYGPPVLDPFCGGGAIPLEAQRLGLRAHGSDLNPVAVLITKALIEIPPKFDGRPPSQPKWKTTSREQKATMAWHGLQGVAEDVRYYGDWVRAEAERRVGHLCPKVKVTAAIAKNRPDLSNYLGRELTVISWLWARTVASPNPACGGAHVPLVKSFRLSTKAGNKAWVEPVIDLQSMTYRFEVRTGSGDPPPGTISKKGDRCLLTGVPISREYIRTEAQAGRLGSRLMAVVAEGIRSRVYFPPLLEHEELARKVDPVDDVADAEIIGDTRYLTPTSYGMTRYRDLFTPRQLTALWTFSCLLQEVREKIHDDSGDLSYADAVTTYLAFAVSKLADLANTLCAWEPVAQCPRHMFTRQAIPISWDFAEGNPLGQSSGSWHVLIDATSRTLVTDAFAFPRTALGEVIQRDARTVSSGTKSYVFSTDPPYYDNVPYADLSDFFYIWLRRCLNKVYPQLLSTVLVPKTQELVADAFRQGGWEEARMFFERGTREVFERMRDLTDGNVPTTVFYAFKQAEEDDGNEDDDAENRMASTGWETFLQGVVDSGWQLSGTWPVRTECVSRMRSMDSNALASSIVLVCRPRTTEASLATRKEFVNAMRRDLPNALRDLQRGSIAPVDLAQAAIGPGMAVFTRYSKVMETDGSPMTVRTALGLINQALDEVLAEQEGEFDTDTRRALAWFEQFGMEEGPFGVAETLSKAKNTAVNGLVEAGIARARGGKVQLLKREELPEDWEPSKDKRLTIWEVTQYLIRTLGQKGESEAAALLHKLGGLGETARDLAYRLYTICERKKWADEALAYNGLVIAWPELTKLAQAERSKTTETQTRMFE